MRKAFTFTLIFTGTILTVFLLNLLMYAMVPDYHDAIAAAVASTTVQDDIPVILPDGEKELTVRAGLPERIENSVSADGNETKLQIDKKTTVSASLSDEKEPQKPEIIDKEYHEDCGTGKGYWVITYDDGSVKVE